MTIVLVLLLNGFGEEVGWRGYALEWLVVDRSALKATLWVSLLWLVWHLPLFFVHRNMADMMVPPLSAGDRASSRCLRPVLALSEIPALHPRLRALAHGLQFFRGDTGRW